MLGRLESEGIVHMRVKHSCCFVVCGQVLRQLVLFTATCLLGSDNLHIDRNACFLLEGD